MMFALNRRKSYLTIGIKSFDSYGTEYVNIMVFEKNGKNSNKYPNPDYQLCIDAYEKGVVTVIGAFDGEDITDGPFAGVEYVV